ncbi:MAG: FecR family protein [Patescibacteria group bacterium]
MNQSNYYYKKPFYKSRKFYFLIICLLAFIYFINWSIERAKKSNETTEQSKIGQIVSANIIFQTGEIEIKQKTGSWQKLSDNYVIGADTSLRTLADAKAIVELPDKSQIRLNQNAEIKFLTLEETDILIEQRSGEAYHRLNPNSLAIYQIKNGATEITALGTAFNILTSGNLTDVWSIENKLKVKIFDNESIDNLKTVEQGEFARINPQLDQENSIKTETLSIADLLKKDWFSYNLQLDQAQKADLGIFGDLLKLILTEPQQTEQKTDSDKIKISGETTTNAKIYALGMEIKNQAGNFSTELPLQPGKNEIEIIAEENGDRNKIILNIFCTKNLSLINLSAKNEQQNIILDWQHTIKETFSSFRLYKGFNQPIDTKTSFFVELKNNETTYSFTELPFGTYHFQLCAWQNDRCLDPGNPIIFELKKTDELQLTYQVADDSVSFSWLKNEQGSYRLSKLPAENSDLSQGENKLFTHSENEYQWTSLSAGKHYFQLCLLNENNLCKNFSQKITVEIKPLEKNIILSGHFFNQKIDLNWQTIGFKPQNGFLTILSKTPNVNFQGGQDHHLLLSNNENSDAFQNLEKGQVYYFIVCENINGACGITSNEISITFE